MRVVADKKGRTPAMMALERGHFGLFRLINGEPEYDNPLQTALNVAGQWISDVGEEARKLVNEWQAVVPLEG